MRFQVVALVAVECESLPAQLFRAVVCRDEFRDALEVACLSGDFAAHALALPEIAPDWSPVRAYGGFYRTGDAV